MIPPKIVTKQDLGRIAINVLEFLDKEGIAAEPDLEKILDKTYVIDEATEERISIEMRPSGRSLLPTSQAYTISYLVPGTGVPLDLKINTEEGYVNIIVKGGFSIQDYSPFAIDGFGNVVQSKRISGTEISALKSELGKLILPADNNKAGQNESSPNHCSC